MELAKVTSKGQITIPVDIRNRLKLKPGDKVVFVEENGTVTLHNSSFVAIEAIQTAMEGAAERANIRTEEDVADLVSEHRRQRRNRK